MYIIKCSWTTSVLTNLMWPVLVTVQWNTSSYNFVISCREFIKLQFSNWWFLEEHNFSHYFFSPMKAGFKYVRHQNHKENPKYITLKKVSLSGEGYSCDFWTLRLDTAVAKDETAFAARPIRKPGTLWNCRTSQFSLLCFLFHKKSPLIILLTLATKPLIPFPVGFHPPPPVQLAKEFLFVLRFLLTVLLFPHLSQLFPFLLLSDFSPSPHPWC